MSTRPRKSWREKLADSKGLPKIGEVMPGQRKIWGEGTMVIPAPIEVDELIRQVPEGKVVTVNDLRAQLAKKHGTAIACPIVTGIGAWIAAHAAEEDATEGKQRITPWWRVLKEGGKLNPKFPGGVEEQARRLNAEGVKTVASRGGKTWRVDLSGRAHFDHLSS